MENFLKVYEADAICNKFGMKNMLNAARVFPESRKIPKIIMHKIALFWYWKY